MRKLLAVLFLLSLNACGAPTLSNTPEETVSGFYDVYMHLSRGGGVPDSETRAKYAPVISVKLEKLLAQAESAEAQHREATQNSEPPFLEGDPFTSLFEGASTYKLGACTVSDERAQCAVDLTYDDPTGGKPVTWTDTVLLVVEDQAWRVDDIAYGGVWDFAPHGRLQTILENVISQVQ